MKAAGLGSGGPHAVSDCPGWSEPVSSKGQRSWGCCPSSLQGGEMYPEGPGGDTFILPAVYPDPGLGGLAARSDLLEPSGAPKPGLVSLTRASSRDASVQTGQPVPSHGLHFWMSPSDTCMSVSMATVTESTSTGESILLGP